MNKIKNYTLSELSILLLSLLGILLTIYLHFQQSVNFEQGCSEGFNCNDVINSFKIFGISNIYWGLLYYITLLSFGIIIFYKNTSSLTLFKNIRNYIISFGLLYSIFLILYQFRLNDFCSLCLISSLICLILFGATILNRFINKSRLIKIFIGIIILIIHHFLDTQTSQVLSENLPNKQTQNIKQKYNLPTVGPIVLGNLDAKITITEWTDFQCPFCAKSVTLVDQILAKYPNDVKVIIKNFPLSFHKQAYKAARYALAAHQQGKFKEMYRMIFENYKDLKENENLPLKYAKELNLNMSLFIRDFENQSIINQIESEKNELRNQFEKILLPTFLIQGKAISSSDRNLESISKIIDAELKK